MKLWSFLNTDIRELNLKRAEEVTKAGTDTAKVVLDLAKTVKEQGSKVELQTLKESFGQFDSLLDVLNSPLALIVKDAIPFAPLAVGILKLIAEMTTQAPTLEQCMMLVSQTAYLDSLRSLLKSQLPQLEQSPKPASAAIAQELKKLSDMNFDERDAKEALLNFPNSRLAQRFNAIFKDRLQETGFGAGVATVWCDRVAWNTNRFINQVIATAANPDNPLVELYRNGGRELLERYQSIETYLHQQIQPLPDEIIFREDSTAPDALLIKYRELYVPLKGQRLNCDGKQVEKAPLLPLDRWLVSTLNDPQKAKHLMFIQGEAGRGKSVFCRMVSAQVYQSLYPSYTPILIRLRGLRSLANRLQDTLESAAELQNCDFVTSDSGWLTDANTRFLFFLDGFDELLLEGRATGGLEEFLKQVEQFQQNSHHRFVITGRPLALMQVERLISQTRNIERIEIQPMDDELTRSWMNKWAKKISIPNAQLFYQFLKACPEDVQKLAQEPLLIYLLARMHREGKLSVNLFILAEGVSQIKILIYDKVVEWVLEKQRGSHNFEMTKLEYKELRQFLTEAATCVVQSGNEIAKVSMLEARLKASHNPAAKLLEKSRQETSLSDSKALNNLLTSFYLKPASGEQGGSIEFVHKSFGEFLFAERLLEALEDWSQKGGRRNTDFLVPEPQMHREIYDLLGYGGLTPDIVSYLTPRLVDQLSHDALITLFERLNDFYDRWCEGEFIDAEPPTTLPQDTMRQLKAQGVATGQRQVDVYTGLNVMILCLELHRYGQSQAELKEAIAFYPSGQPPEEAEEYNHTNRLLKVIHYSEAIGNAIFTQIAGIFLARANIESANLAGVNLFSANLESANLENTNLESVYLANANLIGANLFSANLESANFETGFLESANLKNTALNRANLNDAYLDGASLIGASLIGASLIRASLCSTNFNGAILASADLRGATLVNVNLSFANLSDITWDTNTQWAEVKGLETARNVPEALKRQLGLE
ncbi:MAG: pentapeptide repeat-containing protein [Leptolyngbyaceae cyanobacterium bins.349]|nr:pentapeptide repeat-containing protein [Leptolyngbyaceae cyanobacterium bins.349]